MERFSKWQWLQFSEKTRATAVFYSETAVEKMAVEIEKRQWKKRLRVLSPCKHYSRKSMLKIGQNFEVHKSGVKMWYTFTRRQRQRHARLVKVKVR